MHVELTVNGAPRAGDPEPRTSLADFLRHELRLTGTKVGCEHGVCGACTVLLDGEPVRSCLTLAVQARGRSVTTIEGLGEHPLKQAFHEHHALQCGFCTAGVLVSLAAFLRDREAATDAEIREALAGTLCRCTGYVGMIDAVREVLPGRGERGSPR
jgi:aerobic-type carbon monoxide dehydrogenase small subunit (CoxS/CutS family)